MPPKRKILSETAGNTGQHTAMKGKGTSNPTRQKRGVAEGPGEPSEKRQRIEQAEMADIDLPVGATSTSGAPTTDKKKRKGQAGVGAGGLPSLPSFQPFQSQFESHKAKVIVVDLPVFAKNTSTSRYFAEDLTR